ncbi:hypothetical protein D4764_15G0009160 [Takifugu flavidus]|uniref:Uncharacterized protein n=1 Tax=Takifugu flavidus TaxID=433684 RepID=A0A5C6P142_9TELE|nr:hypothetical protein D4764_15G0009160 [Takifugu flavidus]
MKRKAERDGDNETYESLPKAKTRKYDEALGFTTTTVGDEERPDSGLLSSMGPIKVQQDDSDSEQSNPKEEDSPQSIVEGYEGDEDSSFYQLSEALTNHFYYSNGVLRPKLHPNAILLHSRAQII